MKMKHYTTKMDVLSLRKKSSEFPKRKINVSMDAYQVIREFYSDDIEIYESFFLLLLNNANTTIGYVKISQGGVAGTIVDVKIIAKYAISCLASAVVLAHNHPSGQLFPSEQDKNITKKVVEALKLFEVRVLDHLILTPRNFYSMADEGDI